jgi:hypothetical protein
MELTKELLQAAGAMVVGDVYAFEWDTPAGPTHVNVAMEDRQWIAHGVSFTGSAPSEAVPTLASLVAFALRQGVEQALMRQQINEQMGSGAVPRVP